MIIDPRYQTLAEGLAGYSMALKKGEKALIDAFDVPDEIVVALIRAVRRLGAKPFVNLNRARISRELALQAPRCQFARNARPVQVDERLGARRLTARISATTISSGTSKASMSALSPFFSAME